MAKKLTDSVKEYFKKNVFMSKDKDVQEQEEQLTAEQEQANEQAEEQKAEETNVSEEAQKIEALEAEKTELKDKYMRLFAEFDNYKKRTSREKLSLIQTASLDTLKEFIPIWDDFERAKKVADDDKTEEYFTEGVNLLYNKFTSAMNKVGLTPMESTGETFDPEFHEAITEIPSPTEEMKGKVIDTIERGYLLKDKIVKYAKVVVGK